MEKPFDMKDLVDRCKVNGLDMTEDLAKEVAGVTIDWLKESCAIHSNVLLRLFSPMVEAVRPSIMEELDKIDGQKG